MPKFQVGNNLLNALIQQESGGRRNAISSKGARGLTQILPSTARNPGYGITPLRDNSDEEARRFTRDYLGTMIDKTGSVPLGLAAYNSGLGRVKEAGGIPNISETQTYVSKIMHALNPIGTAEASETPYTDPGDWVDDPTPSVSPNISSDEDPGDWVDDVKPSILERAGKNLPQDIYNIGENTINLVKHPINAIENLGAVARGGMQSALPNNMVQYLIDKGISPEARPQFKAFAEPVVQSVLHPIESFANAPASTLLNAAGVVSGVQALSKAALGKGLAGSAEKSIANAAKANKLLAAKKAIFDEARKLNYVVPQSELAPGFINNRLEGIAGKAALNQESILRNQRAVSAQARKSIKLPPDELITGTAIKDAIESNYKPYEEIAGLPNPPKIAKGYSVDTNPQISSESLLKELKQTRFDANAWRKTAERQGGNPDMMEKAKAASDRAKEIEIEFERRAEEAGKPELIPQLREARKNIATIHSVDNARNVASMEIDPRIIGAEFDKSPNKLTGELKQIGEFQQQFPKYAKAGENVQTPGVSKVEALASLGGGIGVGSAYGATGGLFGAGIPLISTPVRNMLLSDWYQNRLSKLMVKNPSKVKLFMANAASKPVNKKALLGLIASDKDQQP